MNYYFARDRKDIPTSECIVEKFCSRNLTNSANRINNESTTYSPPMVGLDALHVDGVIDSGMADQFVLPIDPKFRSEYKLGIKKILLDQ